MAELGLLPRDNELDEEKRHEVRADYLINIHEHASNASILETVRRTLLDILGNFQPSQYNVSAKALLRSVVSILLAFLYSLRPRYLRKGGLQPSKKAHATTYLDPLRGWAALVVVNFHHFPKMVTHPSLNHPFIKLVIAGTGMVNVFFIISGYVLSCRMLKLMRTQQAGPLLDAFASSVFRRWMRLYGSAAVASMVGMLLVAFGWVRGARKDTLLLQFWDWTVEFIYFSNVFAKVDGYWDKKVGIFTNKYMFPLWTIPVEFRASIILFTFCVGVCKVSTRSRMAICWSLILLAYHWKAVYVAMFLGGLFLADLSYTRHPERLGPSMSLQIDPVKSQSKQQSRIEKTFYSAMLIASLCLLSPPTGPDRATGAFPWPLLNNLMPAQYLETNVQEHFYTGIGAFLLILSLESYPALQAPLKWNFSRYLGDLSFGIYVMHLPVIWTLWAHILNPLRFSCFGNSLLGYVPAMTVNFAVVFWAAEQFVKADAYVVIFGRWMETKLFTW